jgi:hypothetical protein
MTHMALTLITQTPNKLLGDLKKAIDGGHIKTWSYNTNGDFTHTPDQWKDEALMRPVVTDGQKLTFNFLRRRADKTSMELYAIYHGRLAESFLAHFDTMFDDARITALATGSDRMAAVA